MGRERCSGCERAVRVCLCAELPSSPLPSRTSVVVLQHPHEARHKLSTLPLVTKCLANCHILHGRRFQAGGSPLLDFFSSRRLSPYFHALLLFPSPAALPISSWYDHVIRPSQDLASEHGVAATSLPSPTIELRAAAGSRDDWTQICTSDHALTRCCPHPPKSQGLCRMETSDFTFSQHPSSMACDTHPCLQQGGRCFPHIVLIAVDATWQHANEMIKASAPYLDKFVVPVCLPFDADQEGSCIANSELIIRKEPFKGCMTTLEAIACCLKVLEPNGGEQTKQAHMLKAVEALFGTVWAVQDMITDTGMLHGCFKWESLCTWIWCSEV
ncbi:hypothetical protein L7F22_043494 [Adiantum nelumboides]|nr:hypothetical protein [Adiantum nelumboides]